MAVTYLRVRNMRRALRTNIQFRGLFAYTWGAIPEYDNQWNNAGWEGWLTYHPADNPQRLEKPLAIVHSESAAIPQGVRTFLSGFAGDATMQWLEGVTQFDFYDNPEDVTRAADTMAQHFRPGADS